MKEIRILLICFLMCLVTGISLNMIFEKKQKKIGVVDAVRLFDKFNMKTEMEAKAKVKLQLLNGQVDSIGNQLNLAKATQDEAATKKLAYAYDYIRSELDKEYTRSNREINEQVWKRLNPAVEAFGKQEKLHVIIGANGMGSVLYNDDYYDLTDKLIEYVNKKYEEGS